MAIKQWIDWPVEIHVEQEQLQRMSNKVILVDIGLHTKDAITENGYKTSLIQCSCPDFQKRQKPCKHIYALAQKLNLLKLPRKFTRSNNLIADFSTGFAKDWSFGVGTFHWSSLDIKWTPIIKNGESIKIPTQGIMYQFEHGQVFYNNNPELYTHAFSKDISPTIALQIFDCSQTTSEYHSSYTATGVLNIKRIISYGTVCWDGFVYQNGSIVHKLKRRYAPADEFISLLSCGMCIGIRNGEPEDIDIRVFIDPPLQKE